jgi:Electron transfer DM13
MKTFFLKYPILLGFLLLAASCKKEATPTEELMEMEMTGANRTHTGLFVNGPYGAVSGTVHIVKNTNGSIQLLIENLKSTNGPDLKVYLSKEVQPVNFIDLGALKSVNGNQVYDVSGMPDIMEFKYALIHCKAFNHLFGSAELKKN